jgi:hypothetical protein
MRGRPKSLPTIAARVRAVVSGRDPHFDRPLTVVEQLALLPIERIRALGLAASVKQHLEQLAALSPRDGKEVDRLKKLRQRRRYFYEVTSTGRKISA